MWFSHQRVCLSPKEFNRGYAASVQDAHRVRPNYFGGASCCHGVNARLSTAEIGVPASKIFDSHEATKGHGRRGRQDFYAKMRISANAPPARAYVEYGGAKSPEQALTLYSEGDPRSSSRALSEILARSLGVHDFWCRPPYALRTASKNVPGHRPQPDLWLNAHVRSKEVSSFTQCTPRR